MQKVNLSPSKLAVIVGCGGLGQYAIQLAKLTGATVMAVDTSPMKLKEAELLGADACLLVDEHAAAKC